MLDFLFNILKLIVGLAALLALLYAPGAVTLNAMASRREASHLFAGVEEWLFSSVFLSALATGGVGFVLAELGWFHWWSVLLGVLLLTVIVVGSVGARYVTPLHLLKLPESYPQHLTERRHSMLQRLGLLGLLLLAVVVFSRPAEMLRGALDSGVYVNAGVTLGRTGAIFQRDVLMRQLNDDAGEGRQLLVGLNPDRYTLDRLRMPGFYVYDKKAALVVPQHYALYPVWIGLLYSLFGVWGALYATPLLALLAVLAVYFFARRVLSPGAALLCLTLLILCPVTIWFARYPVSEVITGLLAFGGFYAFMRMIQLVREKDDLSEEEPPDIGQTESARRAWAALWGVVAGLSCGELMLVRPDFVFYLAPVPIYLIYWRLSRTWRRPYSWFAVTLAIMLGVFAVHYFFYSYPYTLDLYHNVLINLRRGWGGLLAALYIGVLLMLAIDRLYPRLRPLWRRSAKLTERYKWPLAGGLILLLGGYAFYQYGIAPWLENVRLDKAGQPIAQAVSTTWDSYIGAPVDLGGRYNLLRLGWYLSPLGVVLGVLGMLRWIWNRLEAATWLFFGSMLVVSYVFIQETYTDAHYIYTMRRFVPLILPALIMGIAWSCQFAWSQVRPKPLGTALAAIVAGGLIAFFVYTDRVIVPHVEEQGAVAQLSDLAGRFQGKSVVLFSNERDEPYLVATPLQYIFGINSFALARPYPDVNNKALESVVTRWREQGYTVWVVMGANGGKLDLPNFTLKEEGSWEYKVPEFEQLYYQKPLNVGEAWLPWGVYSLQPRSGAAQGGQQGPAPTLPYAVDIGDGDYKSLVAGFYRQERAESDASAWRWTGDHAVLRLPMLQKADGTLDVGKLTLRLRTESPSADGKPLRRTTHVTVTLSLEDTPIGEIVVPPGSEFNDYSVSVPTGIKKTSAGVDNSLLHIRAPTWSAQGAGVSYDARALGIQVDRVTWSK